ncbi:unnamed protein product [Brassicogethes aeneus]|uniref:Uncharacterized protein n=1 Tax=Brassicogethes aeneus TaxID=1431903 RepID=A0A9P0ASF4_BRAAE|nr:unnamed protein product [Brassicogethes aeneus]
MNILKGENTSETIPEFTVPKLNFNAYEYTDLINWMDIEVTPPPVLAKNTDEDLKLFIENKTLEFSRFPSHTQAVERSVKLVTEASSCVIGEKSRDGFIHIRVKSSEIMPYFLTKLNIKWLKIWSKIFEGCTGITIKVQV